MIIEKPQAVLQVSRSPYDPPTCHLKHLQLGSFFCEKSKPDRIMLKVRDHYSTDRTMGVDCLTFEVTHWGNESEVVPLTSENISIKL